MAQCLSVDDCINKFWFIYTMGYCSALKNKEILPLTTCMDLADIIPNEISQTRTAKNYMISLNCGTKKAKYVETKIE